VLGDVEADGDGGRVAGGDLNIDINTVRDFGVWRLAGWAAGVVGTGFWPIAGVGV
jgi:hypothetical protein